MIHSRPQSQSRWHHFMPRGRRGSVIIIVLWTLTIAAIVTAGLQISSYRQASQGRESVERIQARWAARAGVEEMISSMQMHNKEPVPDDAFALVREMADFAYGDTIGASYDIRHHREGRNYFGPLDLHSRLNVNNATMVELMLLENMWLDVADAILAWKDREHESEGFTVAREYYLSLNPPYEPRFEPFQSTAELELVAGVWPRDLRGEDWNLNGRMDPNEDDGGITFPDDNGDGVLDGGWSSYLTAYTVADGATGSGEPRLYLPEAKIAEVMDRIGVEDLQARAIIRFGRNTEENELRQLLLTPISFINNDGNAQEQPFNPDLPDLTDEQLARLFREVTMHEPWLSRPGKMNLNTVREDFLRDLLELYEADPIVADEIIYLRSAQPEGITSLVQLRDIPEIEDELMLQLAEYFTTGSNVFQISSKGRSHGSGVEVEIIAVVDRSTLPIRILEYREQ